jgi:hypothetical protein
MFRLSTAFTGKLVWFLGNYFLHAPFFFSSFLISLFFAAEASASDFYRIYIAFSCFFYSAFEA